MYSLHRDEFPVIQKGMGNLLSETAGTTIAGQEDNTRQQKSNCQKVFILLQFTAEDLILTFDTQNRFALQLETQLQPLFLEGKIVPRADKGGSWIISSEVRQWAPDQNHFHPNNTEWSQKASDFFKQTNKNRTVLHTAVRIFSYPVLSGLSAGLKADTENPFLLQALLIWLWFRVLFHSTFLISFYWRQS